MVKTSVVILDWNTAEIVRESLRVLDCLDDAEVIVVNNGSDTKYRPESLAGNPVVIDLDRNMGPSIGRNIGIQAAKGDRIFLLDGDILFVAGTLGAYNRVMDSNPHLLCLGQHCPDRVDALGHNGTREIKEAHPWCSTPKTLYYGFPMAWTQYGLFDGAFLRRHPFPILGAFGEPGHGYEDDWMYEELRAETSCIMHDAGVEPVAFVNEPLYYHNAHSSLQEFQKKNMPSRTEERGELFYKRWGKNRGWLKLRDSLQIVGAPSLVEC